MGGLQVDRSTEVAWKLFFPSTFFAWPLGQSAKQPPHHKSATCRKTPGMDIGRMSVYTLSASSPIRVLGTTRFNVIRPIALQGLRTRAIPNDSSAEGVEGAGSAEGTKKNRLNMRTIETMPFQTYQFALDIINKDRQEKLERIAQERETMKKLIKYKGLTHKTRRIISMKQQIEKWQLLVDANNPRVKYNFDCGISMPRFCLPR